MLTDEIFQSKSSTESSAQVYLLGSLEYFWSQLKLWVKLLGAFNYNSDPKGVELHLNCACESSQEAFQPASTVARLASPSNLSVNF